MDEKLSHKSQENPTRADREARLDDSVKRTTQKINEVKELLKEKYNEDSEFDILKRIYEDKEVQALVNEQNFLFSEVQKIKTVDEGQVPDSKGIEGLTNPNEEVRDNAEILEAVKDPYAEEREMLENAIEENEDERTRQVKEGKRGAKLRHINEAIEDLKKQIENLGKKPDKPLNRIIPEKMEFASSDIEGSGGARSVFDDEEESEEEIGTTQERNDGQDGEESESPGEFFPDVPTDVASQVSPKSLDKEVIFPELSHEIPGEILAGSEYMRQIEQEKNQEKKNGQQENEKPKKESEKPIEIIYPDSLSDDEPQPEVPQEETEEEADEEEEEYKDLTKEEIEAIQIKAYADALEAERLFKEAKEDSNDKDHRIAKQHSGSLYNCLHDIFKKVNEGKLSPEEIDKYTQQANLEFEIPVFENDQITSRVFDNEHDIFVYRAGLTAEEREKLDTAQMTDKDGQKWQIMRLGASEGFLEDFEEGGEFDDFPEFKQFYEKRIKPLAVSDGYAESVIERFKKEPEEQKEEEIRGDNFVLRKNKTSKQESDDDLPRHEFRSGEKNFEEEQNPHALVKYVEKVFDVKFVEDVKANSVTEKFDKEFEIKIEDLNKIQGYEQLTESEQLLVLNNLREITIGRIKEEARENFKTNVAHSSWLGKLWKNTSRIYQIAKAEEQSADGIIKGGIRTHGEILRELVASARETGLGATIIDGRIETDYTAGFTKKENVTETQKQACLDFNTAAAALSHMPVEYINSLRVSERREYDVLKKEYENARTKLIGVRLEANGGDKTEAALYMNSIDLKVNMNKFINTHPDAERALDDVAHKPAWKKIVKGVYQERQGAYFLLGFAGRSLAASTLTWLTGPLIAPLTASMSSYRRARLSLNEHDAEMRRGKKNAFQAGKIDRLKASVGQRRTIYEAVLAESEPRKKELNVQELDSDEMNTILSKHNLQYGTDFKIFKDKLFRDEEKLASLKNIDKNFVDGESLTQKIENLDEKIDAAKTEDERAKLMSQLRSRLDYSKRKLEEGLVIFAGNGEKQSDAERIRKELNLMQKLSSGEAKILYSNDIDITNVKKEGKNTSRIEEVERRLDEALDTGTRKIDESRRKYRRSEVKKGALTALGVAGAGTMLRYFVSDLVHAAGGDGMAEHIQNAARPEKYHVPSHQDMEVKVGKGNNLWKILDERLSRQKSFQKLSPHEKNFVIDSIEKQKVWPAKMEDLKAMGFSSKNIDMLHPGDHLHLEKVLGDEKYMQGLFDRAHHIKEIAKDLGVHPDEITHTYDTHEALSSIHVPPEHISPELSHNDVTTVGMLDVQHPDSTDLVSRAAPDKGLMAEWHGANPEASDTLLHNSHNPDRYAEFREHVEQLRNENVSERALAPRIHEVTPQPTHLETPNIHEAVGPGILHETHHDVVWRLVTTKEGGQAKDYMRDFELTLHEPGNVYDHIGELTKEARHIDRIFRKLPLSMQEEILSRFNKINWISNPTHARILNTSGVQYDTSNLHTTVAHMQQVHDTTLALFKEDLDKQAGIGNLGRYRDATKGMTVQDVLVSLHNNSNPGQLHKWLMSFKLEDAKDKNVLVSDYIESQYTPTKTRFLLKTFNQPLIRQTQTVVYRRRL